jgi:putative SOS response-associated peptidase YedK
MKKPVNAFQWREYIAEEKAKQPKQKKQADPAKIAETVSRNLEKKRLERAGFGTIPWLAKKDHMLKPREFLVYSRAGTK